MNLAPLPSPGLEHWSIEQFAPPGLEAVDRLRPASAPYANPDPHAPALVLVPGLNMDARGYVRQLQLGALADVHTLQANNEAVPGEEDFGHFARHVEEYVIAQKLQERPGGFVLGGSSMGGAVSIAICARGRIKPRALVLIGSFANCIHQRLPIWQRVVAPPLSWGVAVQSGKPRVARGLAGVTKRIKEAPSVRICATLDWATSSARKATLAAAIMALRNTRQNQIPKARVVQAADAGRSWDRRLGAAVFGRSRKWPKIFPRARGWPRSTEPDTCSFTRTPNVSTPRSLSS